MRLLRTVFFWLHLAAGLVAGIFVLIMSFTGALLAFEPELVAWAARDVRRVEPPAAHASALPLDELISRARDAATAADAEQAPRVTGVTVSSDPLAAVAVNFGRDLGVYHINQYTGEVRPPAPERLHDFLHFIEDLHRRLAFAGDHRETGRAITGAANAAFLFLAVSGLWLWWPRQWSARFLLPALTYVRGARGRARDWNWHNALGFWSLPVLVVLTATGMVISYRWASDLAYRAVGEAPPPAAAAPAPEFKIDRPADAEKLTYAAALARIQADHPAWTEITLREGLPARRGAPAPAAATADPSTPPAPSEPKRPRGPQPYSATLKADDGAPHFATTQLVLNPFTGDTLDRAGYAELSPGRKVRLWLRHLHTGYALGWPGQLVAGLACLAACVLVYTGFALSWRRFFNRPAAAPTR